MIHHFTAKKAPPPQAVIPVTPGTVAVKDVPVYVRGLGTVQAFNTVQVKSRVDGNITQVQFTEGQEVTAGDPLFQIDPRPYQAVLEQAEANLQKDQSQLAGAQRDLTRYGKLLEPGFQTRQSYEDQQATVGQVTGSTKADQALIDSSKLNIEYANIRSPITGRTGARLVDIGNFIQASTGTNLVTVTQMKPIFVTFTVPQDNLDQIRQNQAQAPLAVQAYGSDDKTLLATGRLTLINNQVDTTTGTVQLKATFDNDDERLWPGEFINARLIVSTKKNALTVPAQTVMQGPNGAYAYTINPDKTVDRKDVDVTLTQDGVAVIDKGLNANDSVVVDGQYRLTKGSKVKDQNQQQQPAS
ncbi:MAG TPA: efflux RND transporter periplasmic adaptor subunit [Alphaproteobacteria bacterium]|nr:efflux RND transporter periplasmic adaptor subunit [Alphaproteobacteria bacterium]